MNRVAPDTSESGREMGLGQLILSLVALGAAMYVTVGLPHLPGSLPTAPTDLDIQLQLLVRSPTPAQLDGAIFALSWLFWLGWAYVGATTLLRIGVMLGERAAAGAAWVRSLRWLSDLLTLPPVRRAVDASLASALLVRVAVLAPSPTVALAAPPSAQVDHIPDLAREDEPPAATAAAAFDGRAAPDELEPGDILHVVRPGESLAYLGERYLGDTNGWKQIYADNRDRPQSDGRSLQEAGKIFPGWVLIIHNPTQLVEYDAEGHAWHTVRHGESLWEIADAVFGDGQRWPEIFTPNQGRELGDGHVLVNPNLIWPGLRLRLPALDQPMPEAAPVATTGDAPDDPKPPASAPNGPADQSERASRPAPPAPSTTPGPATAEIAALRQPTPAEPTTTPLAPVPTAESASESRLPLSPAEAALVAGTAAAAALAVGSLVVRRRRPAPIPAEPESDVQIADGFAEADPIHDLTRRLAHTPDPATVIAGLLGQAYAAVFDERLQGSQREDASRNVSVAATRHGRTSTTLVLAAPVAARPHLVHYMRTAAERAFGEHVDVDGQVDSNGDVLVRVTWHPRRPLPAHLLEYAGAGDSGTLASTWAMPTLVPMLVSYDRQHLAINWHTLHNILLAAPTGPGADVPLVALVAALCSKRTPEDLGLMVIARPHTLPDEIGVLPHGLDDVIDAGDPSAVQRALERVQQEIERRLLLDGTTDESDLVVVIRELCELEPDAQGLLGQIAASGPQQRVQVVAVSEQPVAELLGRCPCVDQIGTRLVLQTATEEDSVALIGMPGAETLAAGGFALLRLEGRVPVPGWAYRLPADRLAGLVHMMGTRAPVMAPAEAPPPEEGVAEDEAVVEAEPATDGEVAEPDAQARPAAQEQVSYTPALSRTRSVRSRKGPPASTDQASLLARLRAAPLRVRCFGAGEAWYRDRLLELGNPELLLLFGVHPIKGITNETLVEMLTWKKFPSDINAALRTRRYDLRQELYRLVPELEGDPLPGDEYQGEKVIAMDPSIVASDVHEFDLLLELARKLEPAAAIEAYEAAVGLYGGDLLDSSAVPKYRWLYDDHPQVALTFRANYQARYKEARLRLADLLADGPEAGLARAEELYSAVCAEYVDDERAWIALFRIHERTGSSAGLESVVRRYRDARVELGMIDVADIDKVPLPANVERIVSDIRSRISGETSRA